MSQSLTKIYTHIIFSTKDRENTLQEIDLKEIHAYIGGIINKNFCQSIVVGGTANHVHILCELSSTVSVAMLLQEIKRSSSKWIKTISNPYRNFAWQSGYGAFSVSQSKVDAVIKYIQSQKEHHLRKSFQTELMEFLDSYGIEYDIKYIWT